MTQLVKKLDFQDADIHRILGLGTDGLGWYQGESRFYAKNAAGNVWQADFPKRVIHAACGGPTLAAIVESGQIHLRSADGKRLANFFFADACAVAVASDGSVVAAANQQAMVKLFDLRGKVLGEQYMEHPVRHLCFTSWGPASLVVADEGGHVSHLDALQGVVWSVDLGVSIGEPIDGAAEGVCYVPCGAEGVQVLNAQGEAVRGYGVDGNVVQLRRAAGGDLLLYDERHRRLILMGADGKSKWVETQPSAPLDFGFIPACGDFRLLNRDGEVYYYSVNDSRGGIAAYLEYEEKE